MMLFKDGSFYEGDFVDGFMQGQGKYRWAASNHWYEGGYHRNLKHGQGCYYHGCKKMKG